MSKNQLTRYPSPLTAPLSKAVRAGDFLFLSGQTPKDEKLQPLRGDIEAQTRNVLETIAASLAELDSNMTQVVRATVWLSDIKLMSRFNAVYAEFFKNALPVRSTVEAQLSQGVDVEIEVTAFAPAH
ncbi:reactive intermediate/imine deaminase [Paraburkholderia sp. BL23I1N1]|uniref:RidA family protein n=1 Tax=Paraburkholderia sp. BL23I1N1 TaxID=1938802 RepID=UPI000E72041C|nr:RidA family protein [Paraburkholderia sp. BL23I1N1]RKE34719.1 reactive intermediate/imine deaminase [Paraburkholderia sp. BL23I1N1]